MADAHDLAMLVRAAVSVAHPWRFAVSFKNARHYRLSLVIDGKFKQKYTINEPLHSTGVYTVTTVYGNIVHQAQRNKVRL